MWLKYCFVDYMFAVVYSVCDLLWQYGVGLDAGSSHTSMYVYKWPAQKLNGTGIVEQMLKCPPSSQCQSAYMLLSLFNSLCIIYHVWVPGAVE